MTDPNLYDRILATITEQLAEQGLPDANPSPLADAIYIDVLGHGSTSDVPRFDGLDAAWAAAEAAAQKLGPDWHVAVVNRDVHEHSDDDEYHGWRASANDGKYLEQSRNADTPAAALHALAARLATPDTEAPR